MCPLFVSAAKDRERMLSFFLERNIDIHYMNDLVLRSTIYHECVNLDWNIEQIFAPTTTQPQDSVYMARL